MDQKSQLTAQAYTTQAPLITNVLKSLRDAEDAQHEQILEKKTLSNDLADYNLLLLRKIYDAFEDRADKVLKNFRSDRRAVLRKRYMLPILNPNYDYEKLLQEMRERGLGKDKVEEDEVKLDGETVCEAFEQ